MWFTTVVARYLRPTILLAEHRNYANIGVFVPDARDTCRLVSYRYANYTAEAPCVLESKRSLGFKNRWMAIHKL